MPHIVLQPRGALSEMQAAGGDRPARPAPSRQPSRELLRGWLLLLLARQASHGYELRHQLEAHGVTTEPGTMYRTLRKLECDGCAASSWAKSVAGPRRRLYELTAKGRSDLDDLVTTITVTRDVHAAFLQAHQTESAHAAQPNAGVA